MRLDDWIGETYAPKLMVAEAVKFIAANQARPFFLYLPFIEPHVAMHPPRESVEKFPEEWDPEAYRGENGYLPHPRPRAGLCGDDLGSRQLRRPGAGGAGQGGRGRSHAGRLHQRQRHDARRHGRIRVSTSAAWTPKFFNSTAGLRGYKGSVYEGGIRVPMIVRLPGRVKAGAVNDTPGYFRRLVPDAVRRRRIGEARRARWRKPVAGASPAKRDAERAQADGLGVPGIRRPGGSAASATSKSFARA